MDPLPAKLLRRPRHRAPRPGDLLVASPALLDPNFRRAVIYLLQHDEEGSAGVVINRRYAGSVAGLDLPAWVLDAAVVHEGGPVADDSMLALGSTDTAPDDVHRAVGPRVCVVDLDALTDVAPFQPLQLFVGYSGWGPGQLTSELARDDWHVVAADPFDVLATDPEKVWRRVMARQSDLTRLWATLPDSVGHN